nr:glycosyltransferase [Dendrosporobacter quercicolus]
MLVHNAPLYTAHSLKTLKQAGAEDCELIVLDNASGLKTKKLLTNMQHSGYIDKLVFLNQNTLFAKGNNIAAKLCSANSRYILLLNSDVEIRHKAWLKTLLDLHQRGATAFGVCDDYPYTRGDGYCFLIDRDLYDTYQLDEEFEWWWSVTKLQAELLNAGHRVAAVRNHERLLYHYGGKSGRAWKNSKGMQVEGETVVKWFKANSIMLIDSVATDEQGSIYQPYAPINIWLKLQKFRKSASKRLRSCLKKEN